MCFPILNLACYTIVILLVPLITTAQAAHGRDQWIRVYPEPGHRNESVKITHSIHGLNHNQTYPSGRILNDNIRSVCGSGVWIFYQHFRYQDTSEMVKLHNGDCVDLEVLAGDVSSLRYVGSKHDYAQPSFTIFSEFNFTRDHVTYVADNNDTYKAHQSFIITGDSAWAVFEQKNFSGRSTCLVPAIDDYVQVQGIQDHGVEPFVIPETSIRSLRKGCSGNEEYKFIVGTERRSSFNGSLAGISITAIVLAVVCILLLLVICGRRLGCCCRRVYDV